MTEELAQLKEHVRLCPMGWHEGRIIRTRSTTDADVIKWLHELQEITDKLCQMDENDS